jgi:lysophospholipase L1-like esterase
MALLRVTKFRIIFFFAILPIYFIIILCGIEICLRLNLHRISKFNPLVLAARRQNAAFTEAFKNPLWEQEFYEYKKNIEIKERVNNHDFQVKMNDYGFRTKYKEIPKPKDKYRIICIGGSTTVEGLTNDTTYPALLEKKLNSYFNSNRIEVFNYGISGLNSSGEKEKLPIYLKMEPDMMIEYNFVNDLFKVLIPQWLDHRSRWFRILIKFQIFYDPLFNFLMVSKNGLRQSLNSYTLLNLKEIYKEAYKNKVKLVICGFAAPDFNRLTKEEKEYFDYDIQYFWKSKISLETYIKCVEVYNQCLEQMCKENDIIFVPVGRYLSGTTDYFVDIAHLTPAGIEKKADIVFTYLKNYLNNLYSDCKLGSFPKNTQLFPFQSRNCFQLNRDSGIGGFTRPKVKALFSPA